MHLSQLGLQTLSRILRGRLISTGRSQSLLDRRRKHFVGDDAVLVAAGCGDAGAVRVERRVGSVGDCRRQLRRRNRVERRIPGQTGRTDVGIRIQVVVFIGQSLQAVRVTCTRAGLRRAGGVVLLDMGRDVVGGFYKQRVGFGHFSYCIRIGHVADQFRVLDYRDGNRIIRQTRNVCDYFF